MGVNFGNRGVRVAGLKSGEVCIYTDEGDKITLKRDRHIEIETLHLVIRAQEDVRVETKSYAVRATQGVTYETPSFGLGGGSGGCTADIAADMAITGNTTQHGTITASGDVTAEGISTAHHTHPGDSGGTTGAPQ